MWQTVLLKKKNYKFLPNYYFPCSLCYKHLRLLPRDHKVVHAGLRYIMALGDEVTMPLTTTTMHGPYTRSTTEVSHSLPVWRRNVIPVISANACNCNHAVTVVLHLYMNCHDYWRSCNSWIGPHVVFTSVECTGTLLPHLLQTCMRFNPKLTQSVYFVGYYRTYISQFEKRRQRHSARTLSRKVTLSCLSLIHSAAKTSL